MIWWLLAAGWLTLDALVLWLLLFATGWATLDAFRRASRLVDARTLTQLLDEDKT